MAYALSLLPESPDGAAVVDMAKTLQGLRGDLQVLGHIEEREGEGLAWSCGRTQVTLRFLTDGEGKLREIEVSLPFGAVGDEVTSALRGLTDVAEGNRMRVFDPQMGRSVGRSDITAISSYFDQASAYHVHYSGVSEDARQGLAAASAPGHAPLISAKVKTIGAAALILVLVYVVLRILVIDSFLDALSPTARPALDPPAGPPSGWLDRHPPAGQGSR